MYHVLALDLDGTVLNDKHEIHVDVRAAILEANKICHVIIVTGRHHTAAKPYYDELELKTPILCCNGTYIYDYKNQSVLKGKSISKKNARQFLILSMQYKMKIVLYVSNAMLFCREQSIEYIHHLEAWAQTFERKNQPQIKSTCNFNDAIDEEKYIWKFVIEGDPKDIAQFEKLDFIKENFSAETSWSNRVDFTTKGNSKGVLLAQYLQDKGYLSTSMMAVGDNHNDISMIQLAGLGVAMENADKIVKSAADLICKSNNNQGGLALLIHQKIIG